MAKRKSADIHDLESLLDVLDQKIKSDESDGGAKALSVEQVLELIGRRAYGPLLLVVGLISISPATVVPFATTIFAIITLLIAVQMAFHNEHIWLPKGALKMKISESALGKFIKTARPVAHFIDHFIRPRFTFLAEPPWVIGIALLCVAAALITFPLSLIPIAPLVPGLAITFFGLGITARDGLLLSIGAGVMGFAGWLMWTRLL